jgi:hypothetical protein
MVDQPRPAALTALRRARPILVQGTLLATFALGAALILAWYLIARFALGHALPWTVPISAVASWGLFLLTLLASWNLLAVIVTWPLLQPFSAQPFGRDHLRPGWLGHVQGFVYDHRYQLPPVALLLGLLVGRAIWA